MKPRHTTDADPRADTDSGSDAESGSDSESESDGDDRSPLWDLPPSAVLAYRVLEDEGPLSITGLAETAPMSKRTARRALPQLEEAGLAETHPGRDARKTIYSLTE